jgi:uncharacterized protein (TIGR02594 family)
MSNYKVTAYHLNVRKEPKLTGEIVGVLDKNDIAELISVSGDAYWFKIKREDGLTGWSSHKYLVSLDNEDDIKNEEFPWMPIAIRELGVKEYSGAAANPRIVEYLRSTTLGPELNSDDKTYWCSAFVNWCVEKAEYEGTDSGWARTWETWGREIEIPRRGCIVVFSRVSGGHVGFYIGESDNKINVLGGNQSDSVCYEDCDKSKLLSYRVPF